MQTSTYNVTGCPVYFGFARHEWTMEEGKTLDDCLIELVDRSGCNPRVLVNASIAVGGQIVAKDNWSYTRPKANTDVVILALPGKSVARLFLTVAGIAAALYLPGALGLSGLTAGLAQAGIALHAPLAPAQARHP
jgi:hypothetical protein